MRKFVDTLDGKKYEAVSGWRPQSLTEPPGLTLGHVAPTDVPGPALELRRQYDMSLRVVDTLAMDGPAYKIVQEAS
jgi:hypothetical protein